MSTYDNSMVLDRDGSVWIWGTGRGDEKGTWPERQMLSSTPERLAGVAGVVSLSSSGSHSLALLEDGTVLSWGSNVFGQLGNGTRTPRPTREPVVGLTDAVAIAAGSSFSLAVRGDGTVWSWGDNSFGTLGDGTRTRRLTPVQVQGLTDVVAVTTGSNHSLALRANGTVWAWGNNLYGKLGDGTSTQRLTPVQVVGLTDVVAIESAGNSSFAVRRDGTVWSWGNNNLGQLGEAPSANGRPVPGQVPGVTKGVSLASSGFQVLALRQDGTVWAWGFNELGQLGQGTASPSGLPRAVPGLHGVTAVAANGGLSLALRRDGTLWGWGSNTSGALGTGTDRQSSPVPLALSDVRGVASSAGGRMLAVRGDGTVWHWGRGYRHPAGPPDAATPVRLEGLSNVVSVAASMDQSLALRADGTVWRWNPNSEEFATPVQVQGLTGAVAVAEGVTFSLALRADGTVWGWGNNGCGQLGNPSAGWESDTPVQVQGLAGVVSVFAGIDLAVAVRGDGTVWFWGCAQDYWDPEPQVRQVPGLTNITHVTVDEFGLAAVRADGTVWQWFARDLPAGTPPRQVEGFTDAVAVAYTDHTLQVVRSDGTVWNQGDNHVGERGFPSEALTPPGPTQVPGLTGVVSLASSAFGTTVHALRADGTAAGWGSNSFGMLGSGLSSVYLEPTQVPLPCRLKVQGSGDDALNRCAAAP